MAAPQRVADTLFRRDMLGPSFGHLAGSATALLLVEKLCMEHLIPLLAPSMEVNDATFGKTLHACLSGTLLAGVAFWGIGGLFAVPALLRVEQWKIQINRSLDTKALWQSMPLIVFNFFLGSIVGSLLLCMLLPESAFDWRRLPSTSTLARDAVVWMLVNEVIFFYVHRLLHENKKLYAAIHKIHHTWTSPISLAAIYCHPVEHLLSNVAPLVAGPILCGSHFAAVGVFLFVFLVHTTATHSGYWFCDDNGMHDEHHRKFTVNYGVLGLMDTWYGTYQLPAGAANHAGPSPMKPTASSQSI